MFAHSHAFYAQQTIDAPDPGYLIGSVLPDAGLTGSFDWKALHSLGTIDQFAAKYSSSEQAQRAAAGMRSHCELDLRSHETWVSDGGYAFIKQTSELQEAVAKACGLTEDADISQIAHNFIEAGVEFNLLHVDPPQSKVLNNAVNGYDLIELSEQLAAFFETDTEVMFERLTHYYELITKYDLSQFESWQGLWHDINLLRAQTDTDHEHVAQAMRLSIELTKSDYGAVLEHA